MQGSTVFVDLTLQLWKLPERYGLVSHPSWGVPLETTRTPTPTPPVLGNGTRRVCGHPYPCRGQTDKSCGSRGGWGSSVAELKTLWRPPTRKTSLNTRERLRIPSPPKHFSSGLARRDTFRVSSTSHFLWGVTCRAGAGRPRVQGSNRHNG